MSKVTADISISLDGYAAGPDVSMELPLGQGGERLHEWMFELEGWRERHGLAGGHTGRGSDVLKEAAAMTGAYVMGRTMFDLGFPHWGEAPPFRVPVFVLTHRPQAPLRMTGGTTFTFVTDGIGRALAVARAAAGRRNVALAGGPQTIQQYLHAGLVDELQIHLVPTLLGDGRQLFDRLAAGRVHLECDRVIESPGVTHLRFQVRAIQ